MKNIILIFTIFIFITSFKTIKKTPTSDSDFYNVMATSGLKMRETPKGKKILTIPYNAQVEKINDGKNYGTLTVSELKDFKVTGNWIKVKYDGKEGFVFDGYLTKFPLPDGSNYFNDVLKISKEKHNIKKYEHGCETTENKDCECGHDINYYNGKVTYRFSYCSEEATEEYFIYKGISMVEAYLITKKLNEDLELDYGFKYNTTTKTINGEAEGEEAGFYSIEIKQLDNGNIQVYEMSSC